jgi:hypothetical protein
MAHDYQMKEMEMVLLESDSDDEIEILSIFAIERRTIEKRASINITSWFNSRPQGHQARLFARPRKTFS